MPLLPRKRKNCEPDNIKKTGGRFVPTSCQDFGR
jgi:hypothetical protein